MQYLTLSFEHDVRDILAWSVFLEQLRPLLERAGIGKFDGDDMAIDGGDCAAVFSGIDAEALLAFLAPHFRQLPLLQKPTTTIELVFGGLKNATSKRQPWKI